MREGDGGREEKRAGKERNGERVRADGGEGGRSHCDHVQLRVLRTDGSGGGHRVLAAFRAEQNGAGPS